ncbi:MAG: hypothetical protein FWF05_05190 [Oscillospiraceae bacterium]|nr:hypothetical protein [Oscillospiraceae bacterium]
MARTVNSSAAYNLPAPAPLRKPQAPPKKPELVPKKPKTREQALREFVVTAKRVVKIFLASAIVLAMFGVLLQQRAELVILSTQISQLQSDIKKAENKKVSLEVSFNSLISIEKVEEYAQNELGMVKQQRYQTKWLKSNNGDRILRANGEAN